MGNAVDVVATGRRGGKAVCSVVVRVGDGGKVVVDVVEVVKVVGVSGPTGWLVVGDEEDEVVDDDVLVVSEGDVVVVSVGCVVVVVDDVEEVVVVSFKLLVLDGSLVSGTLLVVVSGIVVGHVSTVVVVSCTVVLDTAVVSTTVVTDTVVVVLVVVDVSTVVDTSLVVVDSTATPLVVRSYTMPGRHAFGSPQQTPARRRYQPAGTCNSIRDCNPNQSSLAASNMPDVS